jgi:DNA-binding response OmpR family regulator
MVTADRQPHVVVLSDDPRVRLLCRAALDGSYTVVESDDVLAALDAAQRPRTAAIVVDSDVVGLNVNALVRLQRRGPAPDVPVIVLTSVTLARNPGDGVAAVLRKPFSPTDLLASIRHLDPSSGRPL